MRKNRSAKRKKKQRQRRQASRAVAPLDAVLPTPANVRATIVHYHLFKNAGSSVDSILQSNFGAHYATREFPPAGRGADAVGDCLISQPHVLALATHTALLPAPQRENLMVFPILFVRHPIDRLRSAYAFERTQNADTAGAKLARDSDFAGYLRVLLGRRGTQAKNFQTARLAFNEPAAYGSQLERALRAIAILPFIGLVECFDRSMDCLANRLRPIFPEFTVMPIHRNASRPADLTLAQKLDAIKTEIGAELYKAACDANQDDMEIFRLLAARYGVCGETY